MPLMNHLSILARLPGSSAQSQGRRAIPHLCLSNFGEIRLPDHQAGMREHLNIT